MAGIRSIRYRMANTTAVNARFGQQQQQQKHLPKTLLHILRDIIKLPDITVYSARLFIMTI